MKFFVAPFARVYNMKNIEFLIHFPRNHSKFVVASCISKMLIIIASVCVDSICRTTQWKTIDLDI